MRQLAHSTLILVVWLTPSLLFAQLSIGGSTWGLGLGNWPHYTGIRINAIDDDVEEINGFALALVVAESERANGISIGTLASRHERANGMVIGGINSYARRLNGLAIGGIRAYGDTVNGICVAFSVIPMTIGPIHRLWKSEHHLFNGAALGVGTYVCEMNGLGVGLIHFDALHLRGIATSLGYNNCDTVEGIQVGAINESDHVTGVQIGLINVAKNLHGVQIGLVNVAENNTPETSVLPIINAHF